jgi:hypothetical protein
VKHVPHDKMIQSLIEQGLIDPKTHALTGAGHEYSRALIARLKTELKPVAYPDVETYEDTDEDVPL